MVKNIPITIQSVVFLLLTSLMIGCQSVPIIHSMLDQSAQLNNYQTFGFHPQLTLKADQYDSLSHRYIKSAIKTEMLNKGYKYAEEPDLLVNFNVYVKDKIKIDTVPSAAFYYHYRRDYGVWGDYPIFDERITQYTEGTLNVDLIDNKNNLLLWEGVAIGKVSEKTYENLEDRINQAVSLIFERLPK